jgi:hypothetical protein
MAFALTLMPLAALGACVENTQAVGKLPLVPVDIQQCFKKGVGDVPDRALNIAEVESLWKNDRVRVVVMQTCGKRFYSWYENLRVNWK